MGFDVWGGGTDRRFFDDAHWNEPRKWDRKAEAAGERRRVFCSSMADVFERHPDQKVRLKMAGERLRLWRLIQETPNLIWLLLTKRPENFERMLPLDFNRRTFPNVWLGVTVENQHYADVRIPKLLAVDAKAHFLSVEPMVGPVVLADVKMEDGQRLGESLRYTPTKALDWVIAGGESGPRARPSCPSWYRALRDECVAAGVPFLFKQWGAWVPECDTAPDERVKYDYLPDLVAGCDEPLARMGKEAAGRLLDGRTWDGVPEL